MKFRKFLPLLFLTLLLPLGFLGQVHAEDETEVEEEGVWKTYEEGNDKFRISSESIFLIASQNSLFGIIKGDEHIFMVVSEIKAKEYVEEPEEETEEAEEEVVERLGDKYSKVDYWVLRGVKSIDITGGGEEDDYHVIVIYKFKHSTATITYYHSTVSNHAYLQILIEWTNHYNVDNYDVGYLLLIDGEYKEEMCEETEEDGNYYELEIEL